MWILILLLSTGQTVQVTYSSAQACETKRQEYIVQRNQSTDWLNESYAESRKQKWTVENPYPREQINQMLNAKYPKARVDQTFQIRTAECLSF